MSYETELLAKHGQWANEQLAKRAVSSGLESGDSVLGRARHGFMRGGSSLFRKVAPILQEDPLAEAQEQTLRIADMYNVDPVKLLEESGNRSSLGLSLAEMGGGLIADLPQFIAGGGAISALGKAKKLKALTEARPLLTKATEGAALFGGLEAAKAPEGETLHHGLHGAALGAGFGAVSHAVKPIESAIMQRVAAGAGFGGVTALSDLATTGEVSPENVAIQGLMGVALHSPEKMRFDKKRYAAAKDTPDSVPGSENYVPKKLLNFAADDNVVPFDRSTGGRDQRGTTARTEKQAAQARFDDMYQSTMKRKQDEQAEIDFLEEAARKQRVDAAENYGGQKELTARTQSNTGNIISSEELASRTVDKDAAALQTRLDKLYSMRTALKAKIEETADPTVQKDLMTRLAFVDDQLVKFGAKPLEGELAPPVPAKNLDIQPHTATGGIPTDVPKKDSTGQSRGLMEHERQSLVEMRERIIAQIDDTNPETNLVAKDTLVSQLRAIDSVLSGKRAPETFFEKPETLRETPPAESESTAQDTSITAPKDLSGDLGQGVTGSQPAQGASPGTVMVDRDKVQMAHDDPTNPPEIKLVTQHLLNARKATTRVEGLRSVDPKSPLHATAQKLAAQLEARMTAAQARKEAARAKGELHIEKDALPKTSEIIEALDCD